MPPCEGLWSMVHGLSPSSKNDNTIIRQVKIKLPVFKIIINSLVADKVQETVFRFHVGAGHFGAGEKTEFNLEFLTVTGPLIEQVKKHDLEVVEVAPVSKKSR